MEHKPKTSLGRRLVISYIAVSLLIIAITVAAVNGYFNRQFTHYLKANVEERNQRIVAQLQTAYEASHDWITVAQIALSLAVANDVRIVIKAPGGEQIFDTNEIGALYHHGMMNMMRRRMRPMTGLGNEGDTMKPYHLTADGSPIGTAYISVPRVYDALTRIDAAFRRSVWSGSLSAAIIALLVGTGFGLAISHQITKPLQHLTKITQKFSEGNFSERAVVRREDEIGILGRSFNEMADQLARQEANRRKLTSDIFHEVNTPLTAARSLVEAMEDGVLPATEENLNAVRQELVRLGNLMSDVRALSVAESGKLHLRKGPVDLTDVVSSLKQRWTQAFSDKGVGFSVAVPEQPVIVHADSQALFQIASNLISNALKYTPEGGRVEVSLTSSGSLAQLVVKDTGPGIPEDELPLIFERFYRGQQARASDTPGTGVGLAITKELVEAHNGSIQVYSKPGEGTTFIIEIPRKYT